MFEGVYIFSEGSDVVWDGMKGGMGWDEGWDEGLDVVWDGPM